MAERGDMNGTAKPLQDVAGDGYTNTGDKRQLIQDTGASDGSETPSSPTGSAGPRSEISPLQMESSEAALSRKKTREGLKIIIISSISFSISVTVALILTIFLGPPAVPPHGAVSSDVQQCSDLGVELMQKGGSAVDAAVGTILCLGVVNPHHSGLGGGAFILVHEHGKNKSKVFNARETAPNAVDVQTYGGDHKKIEIGGLSVATPGELRGLQAAHKKYGKLKWSDVVKPAADVARNGFNVTETLAFAIATAIDPNDPADDDLVAIFYKNGKPLKEGHFLIRPDLAAVLDYLAEKGVDSFYKGKYGQEIVNATKKAGGLLTLEDLLGYEVAELETLKRMFRNMTIETMPAPGGGPLMLFILHVLQNYTLSKSNQSDPLFYHRLVETYKFMNAERYKLGDPNFIETVENATAEITSLEYAATIRALINDNETLPTEDYLSGVHVTPDQGTAHVSVTDPDEIFVSATTTINQYFGSHIVTTSGIILNNEMADFDLPQGAGLHNSNNYPEGGKRPLSSMTPTVVHQPKKPCAARIAIGATNGSRIIAGVAEVLLNILAFDHNLTTAIDLPRIYNPLTPDTVEYDVGFSEDVLKYLEGMGHSLLEDTRGINVVFAVAKINETVLAHADPREGGSGSTVY